MRCKTFNHKGREGHEGKTGLSVIEADKRARIIALRLFFSVAPFVPFVVMLCPNSSCLV